MVRGGSNAELHTRTAVKAKLTKRRDKWKPNEMRREASILENGAVNQENSRKLLPEKQVVNAQYCKMKTRAQRTRNEEASGQQHREEREL